MTKRKIALAGLGHGGLSDAVLMARRNGLCPIDIDARRIEMPNNCQCPAFHTKMACVCPRSRWT